MRLIKNPARRARSDPCPRLNNRPNRGTPIGPNHTVPYGTDFALARFPGNLLPGVCHTKNPSRRERYDSVDRTFFDHGRRICGVAQLTSSLRDGPPFLGVFQAINCLATIIQSLRDKVRCVPSGQQISQTTVRKIEAIPEYWSIGVLEYCANLELHPASAG